MDENKMGWREYARYAEMSVEDLARDCEVQVFHRNLGVVSGLDARLGGRRVGCRLRCARR